MENDNKIPGKGAATASMVLGIISVVLCCGSLATPLWCLSFWVLLV